MVCNRLKKDTHSSRRAGALQLVALPSISGFGSLGAACGVGVIGGLVAEIRPLSPRLASSEDPLVRMASEPTPVAPFYDSSSR